MWSRFVIVVMLVLLPLQGTAAQEHQFRDDMRGLLLYLSSVDIGQSADTTEPVEPGGICQLHELAKASAPAFHFVCTLGNGFSSRSWHASTLQIALREFPLKDIERPKW